MTRPNGGIFGRMPLRAVVKSKLTTAAAPGCLGAAPSRTRQLDWLEPVLAPEPLLPPVSLEAVALTCTLSAGKAEPSLPATILTVAPETMSAVVRLPEADR